MRHIRSTTDDAKLAGRGNNLIDWKNDYLKVKAIIWLGLSYMCHIRSTADIADSAKWRKEGIPYKVSRIVPESQGQNLALTVLYCHIRSTADNAKLAGRGNNLQGVKDFYLEATARIWLGLSFMCHIRSTADNARLAGRGNRLPYFQDFYLKTKTRIWSCLSYMYRVRSTAVIQWQRLNIASFQGQWPSCGVERHSRPRGW